MSRRPHLDRLPGSGERPSLSLQRLLPETDQFGMIRAAHLWSPLAVFAPQWVFPQLAAPALHAHQSFFGALLQEALLPRFEALLEEPLDPPAPQSRIPAHRQDCCFALAHHK